MIIVAIITFFIGGLVGAVCAGLMIASGNRSRQEEAEQMQDTEIQVNPCTNCTKLCDGRARQNCCDWCKWIHDYNPPCETCNRQ